MSLVELDRVSVHFSRGQRRTRSDTVHALDDVTLTINPGEVLGIVGESGCGKTTLGRVIVGLERPTSGEVVVRGVKRSRNQRPGANAPGSESDGASGSPYRMRVWEKLSVVDA